MTNESNNGKAAIGITIDALKNYELVCLVYLAI